MALDVKEVSKCSWLGHFLVCAPDLLTSFFNYALKPHLVPVFLTLHFLSTIYLLSFACTADSSGWCDCFLFLSQNRSCIFSLGGEVLSSWMSSKTFRCSKYRICALHDVCHPLPFYMLFVNSQLFHRDTPMERCPGSHSAQK